MRSLILVAALIGGSSLCYAQTFHGHPCTEDCSGHEAGYEWAEDNGVADVDDCGGNSNSFIEGCQAYVEENYSDEEETEDDEGEW